MRSDKLNIDLDLPDVEILEVKRKRRGTYIITIESTLSSARCRKCGREISKFYGYGREVQVRHLPILGHKVYVKYRPKRYECPYCDGKPTTTQKLEWHEARSPHTKPYEEHLLRQLVNATVEDVCVKEGLKYGAVQGVIKRRIASEVDWSQYQVLGVLGLDEIALRKGHRNYVTIVSAKLWDGHIAILGVLPNREKQTVKAFLASIPQRLRATIHTVCSDMYEGYTEAAREVLPLARIVIDRFHVAKHYRQAADKLRRRTMKHLKQELSQAQYAELKGSMWAFRKRRSDLKPKERLVLKRLFAYAPELKQAYKLREQLTAIFDRDLRKTEAQTQIRAWIARVRKSGLTCFNKFLNTLDNWWEDILNYFINRHSSGFVEGLNNKIKVLKRRCYGIFHVPRIFQRLWLDLNGYRVFT
jgi:transposase